MKPKDFPKPLLDLLVDVMTLGSEEGASTETVALLKFVKTLRPQNWNLDVMLSWQYIAMKQYPAAREILMALDETQPEQASVKAAISFCLLHQGDALWQAYLEDAKRLPQDDWAEELVFVLQGKDKEEAKAATIPMDMMFVGLRC
jgi:thioredoxin-like negative regulator of GroEL